VHQLDRAAVEALRGIAALAILAVILLEAAGLDLAVVLLAGKNHPYYGLTAVVAITLLMACKGRWAIRQLQLARS